ncbi:MAG: SPFH domain-containing protein [Armatimonadota bacterium]
MAIDVIEWTDQTGDQIVHRWPQYGQADISMGAQLTVRESQAAVFFRDGKALDTFGPGRHTLTTGNLPLLERIINIPFGGKTPFQAEVYFVNMRTFTNLKWGTPTPVVFRDDELGAVRLRAYGLFTMRIDDPQLFVNKVVGTEHRYDTETVAAWLRDFIVSRFNDMLGTTLESIFDLASMYDELGAATKARLTSDFRNYGMVLEDFLIDAVTPPDEVNEMIDERSRMGAVGDMQKFTQYRTAQAIGDLAKSDGGGGGAASTGAGLGLGLTMAQMFSQALNPQQQAEAQQGSGGAAPAGGSPQVEMTTCPQGHGVPKGAKFCPECGARMPEQPATCPNGHPVPPGAKFCPECGARMG